MKTLEENRQGDFLHAGNFPAQIKIPEGGLFRRYQDRQTVEYSDKPRIISKMNGIDPNQITKGRIFHLVFG